MYDGYDWEIENAKKDIVEELMDYFKGVNELNKFFEHMKKSIYYDPYLGRYDRDWY